MLLASFLILLGIALLYAGGEVLVDNSVRLARSFNVSNMVIGLTVIAFGTSCPELAATLTASLEGAPDIAVGNAFGSNVANFGLILGISALIMPLTVTVAFLRREVAFMVFATLLVYPLMASGRLNRLEGLFLFLLLLAFLYVLVRDPSARDEHMVSKDALVVKDRPLWLSALGVALGVALLVGGAHSLVSGAVTIAEALGISQRVIGFTMVAFGTSLPELATGVVATRRGEGDIVMGNLVGSNIFNLLCILGLTALVVPIPVAAEAMRLDYGMMLGTSVLVLVFLLSNQRLVRIEGAILLLIYAAYTGYLFLQPPPATARPNVVLITVDTLRADRLGAYGSRTTRTPHIDQLAAAGLVFDNAVASLPETRPSHYTIFTSLYPSEHGVLSNASPAAGGAVTLAALFGEAGYATAGFAGCALFDEAAGAALGFESFDAARKPQRTAGEVVERALSWLAERDAERPFFLWLHLFDPHMPYEPPPPFNEKSEPERIAALPKFTWPRLLAIAERHGGDLPRHVLERALDLYDGEVEYVDHWLGRFFAELRAAGLYDGTVTLLTSDHGECFENGVFFDHSQCLGEGAIAVPLILHYSAGLEGGRVTAAVEHLDVAPALLRLAGLPVPESFGGRGLLARRGAEESDAFFQHPLYRRRDVRQRQEVLDRLRSVAGEPTRAIVGDRLPVGVRRGPWKYVLAGAEETLYHLDEDPGERVDRAALEPETARRLRGAVRQWLEEHPVELRDAGELDPKLVESLEALGYL